jgi:hypothetical protein
MFSHGTRVGLSNLPGVADATFQALQIARMQVREHQFE